METRTIAVDFGKVDIYSKIEAGLAGLEIGVLGKRTPRSFILLFCSSARLFKKTKQTRCTVSHWKYKKKRLEGVGTHGTGHSLAFDRLSNLDPVSWLTLDPAVTKEAADSAAAAEFTLYFEQNI